MSEQMNAVLNAEIGLVGSTIPTAVTLTQSDTSISSEKLIRRVENMIKVFQAFSALYWSFHKYDPKWFDDKLYDEVDEIHHSLEREYHSVEIVMENRLTEFIRNLN